MTRVFVELVVEYPDPELCTYKEYRGKPYYSIKYIENGETYVGYGTYKPEVLSQYLREYFMPSVPRGFCEYCNEDADGFVTPLEKFGHAFVRFGVNGWELGLKANDWQGSAKIRYCPMCGRDLLVK